MTVDAFSSTYSAEVGARKKLIVIRGKTSARQKLSVLFANSSKFNGLALTSYLAVQPALKHKASKMKMVASKIILRTKAIYAGGKHVEDTSSKHCLFVSVWLLPLRVSKPSKDEEMKFFFIPIPAGHVYAINEALSAEGAADDYETCLKHLVIVCNIVDISKESGFPKFDVMLLGMGPDGHVASLFPGHPLVHEKEKWVTFIKDSPKPPSDRITFTFPVINSSANIALVVAGAGKADVVHKSLGDSDGSDLLPVQMVSPEGELVWFLDDAAASKL
ncbi:probable 6-phosphogluconolactonase 4, chloroplastic [Lycium barbarum]|uniref:probable 6-phosphogluconolactonase 4, chloroplastic n=1 Tax=Lycium barbarum TaxID=112863 RepID=UPI00293F74E3|nr:probable 6-phosphogluconolactonase 4, chloroplastic [Lycium barbarum]